MFYVTTPIYYPNDKPHIGSLFTTVLADFLKRTAEIFGDETFLLTGLDEHGYKLYKTARENGKEPLEFLDEMQKYFREAWEKYWIAYNRFIRTTDKDHEEVVKYVMERLYEKGYIYQGKYEGYYCYRCEAFYPTSRLIYKDGKYYCPVHLKEVEWMSEDTYYLKLTEFKDWIKNLIENKDFIIPRGYKNEVLGYINELEDLSIARPKERVPWGIELPFDKNYTVYVWIDALLNYLSGIGYPNEIYKKYWPAVHVIGKDILKFHAVIWPIVLKMIDVEPPKKILVHGFWTVKGLKMSKSLKNVIYVEEIYDKVIPVRYFLLRNAAIEKDSDFSWEEVYAFYNNELADIIGNAFKRVTSLGLKINNGIIRGLIDPEVLDELNKYIKEGKSLFEDFKVPQYVIGVVKVFKFLNEYFQEKEPWKTKDEKVLYNSLFIAKIGLTLLYPILPEVSKKALDVIGIKLKPLEQQFLQETFYIKESPILFPKIK